MQTETMQSFVNYLRKHVPLSRQINIKIGQLNDKWFELEAPLSPNINDKQTAFGGSLATLCTLSGWCIVSYLCKAENLKVDIAVLDSQIRYRLPVNSDPITTRAYFPDDKARNNFIQALNNGGSARIELEAEVSMKNKIAVNFSGQYYVRLI